MYWVSENGKKKFRVRKTVYYTEEVISPFPSIKFQVFVYVGIPLNH